MIKKLKCSLIFVVLIAVLFGTAFSVFAYSDSVDDLIQRANEVLEWANTEKTEEGIGNSPQDWYVIAAARLGKNNSALRSKLAKNISVIYNDNGFTKNTDLLRVALVYSVLGGDVTDVLGDGKINLPFEGIYNNSKLLGGKINDLIFSLILLNSADIKISVGVANNEKAILYELLSRQLPESGGFTLLGTVPDPDITAMTITAFAPYYSKDVNVASAVEKALEYLSACQQSDGGFLSYGIKNCESSAQVVIALTSLGINPNTDTRFIKNGKTVLDSVLSYAKSDGGFSHLPDAASDGIASAQALLAITSYIRLSKNQSPLYLFNSTTAAHYVRYDKNNTSVSKTDFSSNNYSSTASKFSTSSKNNSSNKSQSENSLNSCVTSQNVTSSVINVQSSKENSKSENMVSSSAANFKEKNLSVKNIIIMLCFFLAVLVLAAIFMLYKKGYKLTGKKCSFLIIAIILLVSVILALNFLNFQSTEDYYSSVNSEFNSKNTVTVSIDCKVLKGNDNLIPERLKDYIPENYIYCDSVEEIEENQTVFDILLQVTKKNKIQLEYSGNTGKYVEGIGYLYEFDCGELSGWMYSVNGETANSSCSEYYLKAGDTVKWEYTLKMGQDLSLKE